MKKFLLPVILTIISGLAFAAPVLISTPAFADSIPCTCPATGESGTRPESTILNDDKFCDCGHGEAIKAILVLVVDIMSVCIGILAAVGITICGVQYLTAGDSEEKTKKAKRRLFEIVIGLLVYVLLYSILKFLLPGFSGLDSI